MNDNITTKEVLPLVYGTEKNNINIGLIRPLMETFPSSEDDLAVFSYIQLEEYPIHSQLHMELVYVAEGSLSVKIGVSDYILEAGEFTIINPFELHGLYATDEPNKTCILEINTAFYSPCDEGTIFVSSNALYEEAAGEDFPKILNVLKRIFALHLAALSSQNPDVLHLPTAVATNDTEYEKILLRSLINYFELYFTHEYFLLSDHRENSLRDNAIQANRLKSILTYFYEHFPQKIQLQDVADVTFVNRYYISHLIKSGIGFTFSELLQHIRIEKSEIYLLGTDIPINQLVFELGFSSYRYFSQHFKKLFNMTPAAYRKKYMYSTIKYKNITAAESTSPQDISRAIKLFSSLGGTAPASTHHNEAETVLSLKKLSIPALYPSLATLSFKNKDCVSISSDACPFYDRPQFSSVLLQLMTDNCLPRKDLENFFSPQKPSLVHEPSDFFCGLAGTTTLCGLYKTTFHLKALLTDFVKNTATLSASILLSSGCICLKDGQHIHLLFYNCPKAFSNPSHIKNAGIINASSVSSYVYTDKSWHIDLEGIYDSGHVIIEKQTIKTQLDTYTQWVRLGKPEFLDKTAVKRMNHASLPDSFFEDYDLEKNGSVYTVSLKAFQVQKLTIYPNHSQITLPQ